MDAVDNNAVDNNAVDNNAVDNNAVDNNAVDTNAVDNPVRASASTTQGAIPRTAASRSGYPPSPDNLTFDPDALRSKYARERQRRLRPEGIAQYIEVAGPFAGFADDPWADRRFARGPLTDDVDVAVIGAGFGGLLIGARLRELGVQSVRLIDKSADVGGTWYWNRYPGIACDVESYVYIPLLEEVGYIPTQKYASGAEILAHCRRIAEHYGLYSDACLQTEVTEIRWDAAACRWLVADPATFEALKPWYGYFCKRPCFHDEYLQTFNRDNVTLVDTDGLGVQCITERGVVVDGTEHQVDCLIFATGFEVGTDYCRRTGFQVVGRDGLTLTDKWRDGVRTYHGLHVHVSQLLRGEHRPVRLHRELPLSAGCPGPARRLGDRVGAVSRRHGGRGHRTCRSRLGWHRSRAIHYHRRADENLHPRLLQQGGPCGRQDPAGELLLRRPNRIRHFRPGVPGARWTGCMSRAARPCGDHGGRSSPLSCRPGPRHHPVAPLAESGDHRSRVRRPGGGGFAASGPNRRPGDRRALRRGWGTWRQNTYPGAACDIQSHLYSLSFAPNRDWSRTYPAQPEILAYLESVADAFDPRRHLMLRTRVCQARWCEGCCHWELDTEHADGATATLVADVVVSAVGLFGAPSLPDIPGLDGFSGVLLHTSRWNPGIDLTGKRVAVIGTGASGVQVVPELARIAARVTVFQRTPPWMVPKDDRAFTAAELSRFRRRPLVVRRERWRLFKEQHANTALQADDPKKAQRQAIAEAFLERHVRDVGLRRALTPDYLFRCKRVLLGADYYAPRQKEHVDLVTEPIDRVTPTSVATAARDVDVDAIVLATGFETTRYRSGVEVIGTGVSACTIAGAPTRRPIWGWRSAAFPTSSCCTGPTPTRAPTRSSTSSRPALGWWPVR